MSRKKQPALMVPATLEEATALIAEYVARDRQALLTSLHYERLIDGLKAERDRILARSAADQKLTFAAIKAWWEAAGKDMLFVRKKRSAELAGAKIGVRLTPAGVKFAKGVTAKSISAWLGRVVGGGALLRTKVELDKQAVIKALQSAAPMAGPLGEQGVSIKQTDEFFIDTQLDEAAIKIEYTAP